MHFDSTPASREGQGWGWFTADEARALFRWPVPGALHAILSQLPVDRSLALRQFTCGPSEGPEGGAIDWSAGQEASPRGADLPDDDEEEFDPVDGEWLDDPGYDEDLP